MKNSREREKLAEAMSCIHIHNIRSTFCTLEQVKSPGSKGYLAELIIEKGARILYTVYTHIYTEHTLHLSMCTPFEQVGSIWVNECLFLATPKDVSSMEPTYAYGFT